MVAEERRTRDAEKGAGETRGGRKREGIREREREEEAGEAGECRDRQGERLPTVYTYIMQMLPIISEVYNRSINLLTGRKGSGGHVTACGGGFLRQLTHIRIRSENASPDIVVTRIY